MTELTDIIRNMKAAVLKGELTKEQAAELLNDFQDHEFEAHRNKMRKTMTRKSFDLIALCSRFFGRISYYSYIRSPQWKARAKAAKRRVGNRCQVCNKSQDEITLNAHHRTYERLGHERPEDITVLCRSCHELYEMNK